MQSQRHAIRELEKLVADLIDAGDPTLCARAHTALRLILDAQDDTEVA